MRGMDCRGDAPVLARKGKRISSQQPTQVERQLQKTKRREIQSLAFRVYRVNLWLRLTFENKAQRPRYGP